MSEKSRYNGGTKRERCYLCDSRGPLQEHHIVPQRFDGSDSPLNIVEVCQLCHQRLENLYDKRFYEQLGVTDEKGERRSHRDCLWADCDRDATRTVSLSGSVGCYCDEHPTNHGQVITR